MAAQVVGFSRGVGGYGRGEGALRGGGYVEAGGEGAGAGACEEDGPDGGVVREGCEDLGEGVPHSGGLLGDCLIDVCGGRVWKVG